ncbi:MAG: histidine kinase [Mucilaginibacter sp.]|nr:histidine kinase [Mucilaginibacter sp.]
MSVVLHEGRKPLNALKQHPKFISEWTSEFTELLQKNYLIKDVTLNVLVEKIIDRLNDNKIQAEIFVNIFKKLQPLANSKRPSIKQFKLYKPISDAFKLFEAELTDEGITFQIIGDDETVYTGWEVDFYIVFANLIENSIFWLKNAESKLISVNITDFEKSITIDYSDTGEGIDDEKIDTQNIFDPGFSTKIIGDITGTGLGLSIAGEALERNDSMIRAVSNPNGANFIIELIKNL